MPLATDDERISTCTTIPSLGKVTLSTITEDLNLSLQDNSVSDFQDLVASETGEGNAAQNAIRLKHHATNSCFIISVALTQMIGEYLISGYSILLPSLLDAFSGAQPSTLWLASALTIVSASTTLPLSRIVDIYGGYFVFLTGASFIVAWTLVCAFALSPTIVIISRAMQGIGVAALQPAVFSLVGTRYPPGKQRNTVLGICSAAAPLGFFIGIATSGLALTYATWRIYFYVPAGLSLLSMVLMHISTPDGRRVGPGSSVRLQMDWMGAVAISSGLFSVMYALAVASRLSNGWSSPQFAVPLALGLLSLLLAAFIEARVALSPLLPSAFFSPKSLPTFCLAVLFFYASFGVFLFYTPLYMDKIMHASALEMVLWNVPFAAGGCILACAGGLVFHVLPITYFVLVSGVAWVLAPLLLAVASPTAPYWNFIFPSMLCATLGIDVTYTISTVFFSAVQPAQYQGLAGSVCSMLLYVGMSFSVGVAEIVRAKVELNGSTKLDSYRAAFIYAAGSAGIGFTLCVIGVRIPRVNQSLVERPS